MVRSPPLLEVGHQHSAFGMWDAHEAVCMTGHPVVVCRRVSDGRRGLSLKCFDLEMLIGDKRDCNTRVYLHEEEKIPSLRLVLH